jgi:hypothetical protein
MQNLAISIPMEGVMNRAAPELLMSAVAPPKANAQIIVIILFIIIVFETRCKGMAIIFYE